MYIEDVKIFSLQDLLDGLKDKELVRENILKNFENKYNKDIEDFLHNDAIRFEKAGLSSTHLVFNENFILLGYFSLANKPLLMSKQNYEALSKNQRKKLCQNGKEMTSVSENGEKGEVIGYIVNSYLLGQIGKNHSEQIKSEEHIDGTQLLTLAYDWLMKVKKIVNGRYVWLECEDNEKLLSFYKKFGFEEIENFISGNGLKVLVMKLKK